MSAWGRLRTGVRTAVAVGLLAGIYLLAVGILALCIVLAVLLVAVMPQESFLPAAAAAGATLGLFPVAIAVWWGVTRIIRIGPPPAGVTVTSQTAPGLCLLVIQLADTLGVTAPEQVVLTAKANASVQEDLALGGFVVRKRRLCVGVPLLMGLTVDELRAVLCHELAHYAGRHTRHAQLVRRGAVVLEGTVGELSVTFEHHRHARVVAALTRAIFGAYTGYYLRVSAAKRRWLETEADAVAVTIVGPSAMKSALLSGYAINVVWQELLQRTADPAMPVGAASASVFDEFEAVLVAPAFRDLRTELEEEPPEEEPGLYDSHPTLGERLAVIDDHAGGPAVTDEMVAEPLVADLREIWQTVREAPLCDAPRLHTIGADTGEPPDDVAGEQRAVRELSIVIATLALVIAVFAAPPTGHQEAGRSMTVTHDPPPSPSTSEIPLPPLPSLRSPIDMRALQDLVSTQVVLVEPGDTLSAIACRYLTTVAEIIRLNNLSSTELAIGQKLTVPQTAIVRMRCS